MSAKMNSTAKPETQIAPTPATVASVENGRGYRFTPRARDAVPRIAVAAKLLYHSRVNSDDQFSDVGRVNGRRMTAAVHEPVISDVQSTFRRRS
jgi:hypothetical protein